MAGGGILAAAWKEWRLQGLVLLSLTIQVTLVISAEFRRYIDSGVLRALVWSAYMLADATAIYVLGHLSVIRRSPEPEHGLLPLWAPFLLLHLGGQDKITAYAIEDNRLWLRHLQTLLVQVAAAAYILYGSSIVGGSRPPLLLPATLLMFVVGVVKYGERVWALKLAGSNPSAGNYKSDIGRRRFNQSVPESLIRRLDAAETFVLNAHMLLDLAKDKFKGPLPRLFLCGPISSESQLRGEEELYKVAEMQLSLLHDVFYTKAEATHTWHGLCIRLLSWLATVFAFLLFTMLLLGNHHRQLKRYNPADVSVTCVLFVGAVVLETTSLLRTMLSSWTCALLVRHASGGSAVCTYLALVPLYLRRLVRAARWRRRRSWSRSMGQLNLIQLCVSSRASRWSKMARWVSAEDWWNLLAYSGPSVPVSACVKNLLLKSSKAKQWGWEQFESRGLHGDPAWVADSKQEQRILIWHIATEVYLCWYNKDRDRERAEATGAADLVEVAQALSNYMVFLLASRPHMMPPDASRNDYLALCYALTINSMKYSTAEELLSLLQRYADALWVNNSKPEFELACKGTNLRGDKVLRGGCSLGAFLIHQQDSMPADGCTTGTLEMICRMWAQMLCCVADECSVNSHVKQLSSGGELLTVAALIAKYMRSRRLSHYFGIKSERKNEW